MKLSEHVLHPLDDLWYKDTSVDNHYLVMYVRRCTESRKFYIEYEWPNGVWSAKSANQFKLNFPAYEQAKAEALKAMSIMVAQVKRVNSTSKRL